MDKRLYRSTSNRMLGGVCSGLGAYLNIDATFVRLFFILISAMNGICIFIYILLWIILPSEYQLSDTASQETFDSSDFGDKARNMGRELHNAISEPNPDIIKFIGVGFILFGVLLILKKLDITWFYWLDGDVLFPLVLIAGGLLLLWRTLRK